MLMMDRLHERVALKKYFYGDKPWVTLLFWAGIVLFVPTMGLLLLAWLFVKLYFIFGKFQGEEKLYDDMLAQDVEYIKNRSVSTMGLIEEEYSLIDPIVAFSFADERSVKWGAELTADKKNVLQMIWEAITRIPRAIFSFFRNLTGGNDYISKAVYYEGHDHIIRCSLVSVTVILFTEQQILSYSCNYDIALGIILEENVREVFYRDVDSVNYGDETYHIQKNDGTIIRTEVSKLRLAVSSGSDINASMIGQTDFLENQIMATKSLIRSKKESLA